MACCFNVVCFFCALCIFIGLASLIQLCLGIYLSFIENDVMTINRLIKNDKFDSYLTYILLVFIGLGFISLVLVFFSIYGMVKRNRCLTLFVSVLWIFTIALNLILFTVLFLYYYMIFPQLHSLLLRSFQQSPSITSNLLDNIELKYNCCGINGKDDYNNLSIDHPFPSSCCRVGNCWNDTNINNNNTIPLVHKDGCYPFVEKYVIIELWVLVGIVSICALLQIFAITLMCILNQRYKKLDDNPKFTISHLTGGVPINGIINNNIEPLTKNTPESLEITQI